MVEAFRRCTDHLEKFGGHEHAGGLSIKKEQFVPFSDAFERAVRERLAPENLSPLLEIDACLKFSEIGFPLMRELDRLKPFGVGNPEPLFMSQGVEVCESKLFSGGARFRFQQGTRWIGGVAFGIGENFPAVPGATIDLVYRLSENEWNGGSIVELKIVDARPAAGI
jgi:single-stranded-DNA-specific exonuclease